LDSAMVNMGKRQSFIRLLLSGRKWRQTQIEAITASI
jgi:hypothetical protein